MFALPPTAHRNKLLRADGQSTNSHNDADSLYTVFPVESAGLLGETVDPAAVLIANTSAMLGCDAVFNNSENKSVFWTPTPYAGTRGCHFWTQTARIVAAHPTPRGTPACVLRSWEPCVAEIFAQSRLCASQAFSAKFV